MPLTWYVAHQAPLLMRFRRQEYWSGFAISFFRISEPETESASFVSPALTDGFFTTGATWEAQNLYGI